MAKSKRPLIYDKVKDRVFSEDGKISYDIKGGIQNLLKKHDPKGHNTQ